MIDSKLHVLIGVNNKDVMKDMMLKSKEEGEKWMADAKAKFEVA